MPFKNTFGEVLERFYADAVTAINFGVPGYGPDQSLRRFLDVNQLSTAKAVVFHIFADNDYGDLFRNNIYRFAESKEIVRENLTEDPVFFTEKYLLLKGLRKVGINPKLYTPDGFYELPHHDKTVPPIGKDELVSLVDESNDEYARYKAGMWTSWIRSHYDYSIATHPRGEVASSASELMSYILRVAFNAYLGKKDCFVVLIQPSEIDVGRDSFISRDELAKFYPDYYPRALGVTIKSGVRTLLSG